ncbi:XRE family transcriptional regulator [Pedobacter chinensis]|uniref:XRE family transcriptional regulator n=1 Tax=Pedobacter chinensis TaxID=2282421 RepID=A0A369Q3X4_9SPHI|nr:helix-turn-helix transcriptional regulator [Pedobacter chinensis]RDC57967.1 XRE family transcriptional regulator [Pedobacter chinensis]
MGKQYKDQSYLQKVGLRLAQIRDSKKITQEKLSELTKFDTRQIGRIERAETNASISIIKAIADKLKVNVSEILDV